MDEHLILLLIIIYLSNNIIYYLQRTNKLYFVSLNVVYIKFGAINLPFKLFQEQINIELLEMQLIIIIIITVIVILIVMKNLMKNQLLSQHLPLIQFLFKLFLMNMKRIKI